MLQVQMPQETWIALYPVLEKSGQPVVLHIDGSIGVGTSRAGAVALLHGRRNGQRNGHRNGSTAAQPTGGNVNTDEVLELIRANPGITATEIRQRAPITPGMLGSILQRLARAGTVRATGKRGMRRYRLAETQATA